MVQIVHTRLLHSKPLIMFAKIVIPLEIHTKQKRMIATIRLYKGATDTPIIINAPPIIK